VTVTGFRGFREFRFLGRPLLKLQKQIYRPRFYYENGCVHSSVVLITLAYRA